MKTPVAATAPVKTAKSANRKVNQETIEKRKASREIKFNFAVDSNVPMPTKGHRSKYDYEQLTKVGDSFFWPASKSLCTSIKNTARTKFNRNLVAFPRTENGVEGFRFWLKSFVKPETEESTGDAASQSEETTKAAA